MTHEDVTFEQLGGANTHTSISGVAHFAGENEEECLYLIRRLVSFIPSNNMEDPPLVHSKDDPDRTEDELNSIIPDNPNQPYDMKRVIELIVDQGDFFEVAANFAQNIIIGFARFAGRSVGIVAQQPGILAGALDISASVKAARLCPILRLFQHPDHHFAGCARIPAGRYAGARRHHNSRSKAALRLLRINRFPK